MLDFPAFFILGQTTPGSRSIFSLMVALAIFVIVVGGLLALLSLYRRKMHGDTSGPRDFTLNDLRALHREGKLTDDEFERAKARLVGSMHAKLLKEKKPSKHEAPMEAEPKDL